MNTTVLVTEPEFLKAEDSFRRERELCCEPAPPDEMELAQAVDRRGARAVVAGAAPYRGPLYEALGRQGTTIIARFGVGHDGIDKPLARRHGIVVTNTPGTLDDSVAEHTLWLIGALARQISRSEARFRTGEFASSAGLELRGKLLGVLGFGRIGRKVAAAAHFGFGMEVLAADVRIPAEMECHEHQPLVDLLARHGVARYTHELGDVLGQADVLSVHVSSTPQTRHLLNAGRLREMKPGALLINTARGAVLDEGALYDVLIERWLGGAALDVFEHEPYRPVAPDKDLRTLDNVVLTPHIGSNTREANRRMAVASLGNIRNFLAGRWELLTRVDLLGVAP